MSHFRINSIYNGSNTYNIKPFENLRHITNQEWEMSITHWIAIFTIILFLNTSLRAENQFIHQVKVGVEDITPDQRTKVWKLMDQYAQAETVLRTCSSSSNIENRIFRAIEKCVDTRSINMMRSYFKKRMSVYQPQLLKSDCGEPIIKGQTTSMRKAIDDLVKRAKQLCDECLLC